MMRTMTTMNLHKDRTLNRAIALSGQGKNREAVKLLQPLARQHPRSAAIFGCLGGTYFELGEMDKAAKEFRRATQLNPKSELASLGLFHSLWGQGAAAEAFAEMRRFLSISDSAEYTTLLRDLAMEGHLAPQLEPAEVA
jgi:predicted Zn-dependent protease